MEMTRGDVESLIDDHKKECSSMNNLVFLRRPSLAITLPIVITIIVVCVGAVYAYWSGINNLAELLGKKVEDNSVELNLLKAEQSNYSNSLREFKVEIRDNLKTQGADIRQILRTVKQ